MRSQTKWMLIAAGVALAATSPAYAWGPATHVALGAEVLGQLALLPAGVAAVLARHKIAFLYGGIAADVVFAKRLSRIKQFCHHWTTAFRIFHNASDREAEAFAYGYLAHLAADTVAHGKFVPRQTMVTGLGMNLGHIYWELRADSQAEPATWKKLREVLDHDHSRHHRDLAPHLKGTFLGYPLNRAVFEQFNAVAVKPSVRRAVDAIHRRSRWYLSPALVRGYRAECVDRILSVLTEHRRSAVLKEDPNGTSALMQTRIDRRRMRRMVRVGLPVEQRLAEVTESFAPAGKVPGRENGALIARVPSPDADGIAVDA